MEYYEEFMYNWTDKMDSMVFDHLPADWSLASMNCIQYSKKILEPHSREYQKVLNKFNESNPKGFKPSAIYKVMNPYIYGRFQLRKLEYESRLPYVRVLELFHTTAEYNVDSIMKYNLNWRLVKRSKFGKGVSFSPYSGYADDQCNRCNGAFRTAILCDVLVGNSHNGGYASKIPYASFDTTTDKKGKVYVKYQDDEFLPKYLINYNQNSIQ